jgi:uncharacterized protein YdaU (DUF1376 family)
VKRVGQVRRRSGSTIAYPFFPAYASDWLSSGTRAQLSTEQRGVFWELIFHAWLNEDCMLPDDDRILAAYSGLEDERWAEIGRTVVERAFNKKGQRQFNKRQRLGKSLAKYARKPKKKGHDHTDRTTVQRPFNDRSNGRSTTVERSTSTSTATSTARSLYFARTYVLSGRSAYSHPRSTAASRRRMHAS